MYVKLLVTVLVLSLGLVLPGCKKSASSGDSDAVTGDARSQEGDVKEQKKAQHGRKAKGKKGKRKGKKKSAEAAATMDKGEPRLGQKAADDAASAPLKPGHAPSDGLQAASGQDTPAADAADAARAAAGAPERAESGIHERGGRELAAMEARAAAAQDRAARGATPPDAAADRSPAAAASARPGTAGDTPAAAPLRAFPPPPVNQLNVSRLLTVADLSSTLPEKGWIAQGPIQGMAPSETYNSMLYVKPGTSGFVSIQAWDLESYAQAIEKWNEMLATYPNASEQKEMFTNIMFFSYRNQVSTLAFVEPDHAMVVSVSCHSQSCDDTGLYELAKLAYARAH